MTTEKRIEFINETLHRADNDDDQRKSIGGVIFAIGYLVEIVEEQQRRIEQLEDVLQKHLETTPRRR